ncbi:MAG: FISUMP domain-containing protein [Flavobacteriales bacterium]
MKQILLITIILLAHLGANAQDAKQQAKAYYFQAETMLNAENYAKAVELLEESKQLLGNSNASIESLLVKTHFQNNDYPKAKKALDAFYTYNPSDQLQKQIAPFLVQVNDKLKEKEEAEQKKLEQKEALFSQYIEKGNSQVQKGELPAAIESFKTALKIKPNDAYASKMQRKTQITWNNKMRTLHMLDGKIAVLEENLDEARDKFQQALKLVPGDTSAQRWLNDVDKLYPVLAKKYQTWGDNYFVKYLWRDAKENYNKSLEYQPKNPYIKQKLAEIHAKRDKGFRLEDFTDPRDGNVYGVVQIGDQTWMTENMRYETEGSACYDNFSENCSRYGRLYNRKASKKACPEGWKLPSEADLEELISKRNDTYSQYTYLTSSRSGFNATTGGSYSTDLDKPFSGFAFGPFIGIHWTTNRTTLVVFNESLSDWNIYKKMVRQSGEKAVHELMEPGTVSINKYEKNLRSDSKFNCRCIKRTD